jgi:hypothetical protein
LEGPGCFWTGPCQRYRPSSRFRLWLGSGFGLLLSLLVLGLYRLLLCFLRLLGRLLLRLLGYLPAAPAVASTTARSFPVGIRNQSATMSTKKPTKNWPKEMRGLCSSPAWALAERTRRPPGWRRPLSREPVAREVRERQTEGGLPYLSPRVAALSASGEARGLSVMQAPDVTESHLGIREHSSRSRPRARLSSVA